MDHTTSSLAYWNIHYTRLYGLVDELGATKSLEYSNEPVQLQTYAHILEAFGSIKGLAVLDAGCGLGCFTVLLHVLGARALGVDFVQSSIADLRQRQPEIAWDTVDITSATDLDRLGRFDRVAAVEVLQYSGFETTVTALWTCVKPGGRLIGSVPNDRCPIATKVKARYRGHWRPVSEEQVLGLRSVLPDVSAVHLKGLTFADVQSFLPYEASLWRDRIEGTPNRIVFAVVRD